MVQLCLEVLEDGVQGLLLGAHHQRCDILALVLEVFLLLLRILVLSAALLSFAIFLVAGLRSFVVFTNALDPSCVEVVEVEALKIVIVVAITVLATAPLLAHGFLLPFLFKRALNAFATFRLADEGQVPDLRFLTNSRKEMHVPFGQHFGGILCLRPLLPICSLLSTLAIHLLVISLLVLLVVVAVLGVHGL